MSNLSNDQWQEAIVQLANSGISPGAVVDTFGNAATITAATTFSGVPTISQLAANSSALLANPGDQATFIAEIAVASAFVGTLSFYGLAPDGATLQLVGAHLRGVGTTANSTAINTGSALNQVWMGSAANFKTIYVVCTAFTSGSASVQLGLSAAPYALAILNTANVSVSNANANGQALSVNSAPVVPASDYNFPVKGIFNEPTVVTASALNADLVPSFDASAYKSGSIQILSLATGGTLSIQQSNDNVNFITTASYNGNNVASTAVVLAISVTGLFSFSVVGRYVRIRQTAWTSGSTTGVCEMFSLPCTYQPTALQQGTWTVQPGNTANTISWLTNGANNNAVVAAAAGSVTVIKASAGVLACVTITTAGTVATNIFDNASAASGTVLLALPATTTLGQIFTIPGTAKLGITAAGSGAGAPGYTVYFS